MSMREQCLDIVRKIPDEQLSYIAAILENAQKMVEEAADMAFCVGLSERYEKNNPEHIEENFSAIEDVKFRRGVLHTPE